MKAPFDVKVGSVQLHVPKHPRYFAAIALNVSKPSALVALKLCARNTATGAMPAGCDGLELLAMNEQGIQVYLGTTVLPPARHRFLRQRPPGPPPAMVDLVPLGPFPNVSAGSGGIVRDVHDMERGQIDRLLPPWPSRPATTVRHWPVADCSPHPSGDHLVCATGFYIRDMYVEAHWTDDADVRPTQYYVWWVSSEIEAQVRG